MTDTSALAKLVPGFEFLQSLAKTAGSAIPGLGGPGGIGQWVAPTLDPAEIGKRIDELRTVQFWLEQNAKMLATTIQALEVQRMTLSTLKTMNVPLGEFRDKGARAVFGKAPSDPAAAESAEPAAAKTPGKAAPSVVDPMQWWTALTGQFAQLASSALKDGAADTAKAVAGTMLKATGSAATQKARKAATRRKRPTPAA